MPRPGIPVAAGRGGWVILGLSATLGSLSILLGVPWLPVLLQALPAWWVLWSDLRRGRPWRGAGRILAWAVLLCVTVVVIAARDPGAAAAGVVRGAAYREEMLAWIRTGAGAESVPSLFIPQHALHYALVLGLSAATAGMGGLVLGTVLLDYMNYHVGSLVHAAADPLTCSLAGWPPWSILRVAGFILGAVAAAHVMLGRVLRRSPWDPRAARTMLLASLGLVLADIAVKAILAPHWRVLLLRALGD